VLVQKLPDNPEKQFIKSREKVLQTQRGAVSKKLSDVILENQPSYTKVTLFVISNIYD